MQSRTQSATEFLTTYGFVIFIIVIAIAVLFVFLGTTNSVLPTSCYTYGTVGCTDVVYGGNAMTGMATLVVRASDQQEGTINVSSFSAVVGGSSSTGGYCSTTGGAGGPTAFSQGQIIYCVATFPTNAIPAQAYSGTFNITGSFCPGAASACPSTGIKYSFGGSFRTQGTASVVISTTSTISQLTTPQLSITLMPPYDTIPVGGIVTFSNSTKGGTSNYVSYSYSGIAGLAQKGNTFEFDNPGTYNIVESVTDSANHVASSKPSTIMVTSVPLPLSIMLYPASNTIGAGQSVTFTNQTKGGTGIYASYSYTFNSLAGNGGSFAGSANRIMLSGNTATFPDAGTYTVVESVTDSANHVALSNPSTITVTLPLLSNPCLTLGLTGVGNWISTTQFPATPELGYSCASAGGDVYCADGESLSTSYYAPFTSSGVGNWISTAQYPAPLSFSASSCTISNGDIYCAGTYTGDDYWTGPFTYYAPISSSGIGNWIGTGGNAPIIPVWSSCASAYSYMYCIGGYEGGNLRSVYDAQLSGNGIVGTWASTTQYPISTSSLSCTSSNGYIYCVGGGLYSYTNSVYYAQASSSGGIEGNWISTTPYPIQVDSHSCVSSNSDIYCVGGYTNSGATNSVYYAPISSSGVGNWIPAPDYPSSSFENTCTYSNGYIYCLTGDTQHQQTDTVYYTAACPAPATPLSITLSPASNTISTGQNVIFTNTTVGGKPPYVSYSYTVDSLPPGSVPGVIQTGNKITFADAGTYTVVESVIDSSSATAYSNPSMITVNQASASLSCAYVVGDTYSGQGFTGTLYGVNTLSNTITTNTPLGTLSDPLVGNPYTIALSPDGSIVYTLNAGTGSGSNLLAISTASGTVVNTMHVGGQADAMAITPDGKTAYVLFYQSPNIDAITLANGLIDQFSTPATDYLVMSPSSRFAYVSLTNGETGVLDTSLNEITNTIPAYEGGYIAISPDGSHIYRSSYSTGSVGVISTVTNSIVGALNGVQYPLYLAVSPNSNYLYVAGGGGGEYPNTLYSVNLATNAVTTVVSTLSDPLGVAITPDSNYAYVTSGTSNTLYLVDLKHNTIASKIGVGPSGGYLNSVALAPACDLP